MNNQLSLENNNAKYVMWQKVGKDNGRGNLERTFYCRRLSKKDEPEITVSGKNHDELAKKCYEKRIFNGEEINEIDITTIVPPFKNMEYHLTEESRRNIFEFYRMHKQEKEASTQALLA